MGTIHYAIHSVDSYRIPDSYKISLILSLIPFDNSDDITDDNVKNCPVGDVAVIINW